MSDERPATLPHSNEAERAVLGGVFLDPTKLDEAIAILDPEDWYSEARRTVWRAATTLRLRGEPVDPVTGRCGKSDSRSPSPRSRSSCRS